jgi:hypothetical protein
MSLPAFYIKSIGYEKNLCNQFWNMPGDDPGILCRILLAIEICYGYLEY